MNASQTFSQGAVSILGAEPFPTTTYSLDIPAGAGVLKAGTLLARAGTVAVTAAGVHGVDTNDMQQCVVVVYLTGSFLRDLVIAANSGATIDAAFEDALRAKGIYLERSVGT